MSLEKPAKPKVKAVKATAAKPKTAADKPKSAKKSAGGKSTTPSKKSSTTRAIGAEERYKMIEVAAYYIAERDQFRGSAIGYWIAAEAEIERIIN